MATLRRFAAGLSLVMWFIGGPFPAAAQSSLDCDTVSSQESAQKLLDQAPNDPFGFDPDGNGIACDEVADRDPVTNSEENSDEDSEPSSARLGGTIQDWEAQYGSPIEMDGENADLFTVYDISGYSAVFADEHLGRIESISLFSPRPQGEEWSNDRPHRMDWTLAKAHELALRFLPTDVECEVPDEDRVGGVMTTCASDTLADEVPGEVYDYVDNTPRYGECSYWLDLNEDGRVSNVVISLAVEEPLQSGPGAAESELAGQATEDSADATGSEAQQDLSEDELAYANEIVEQTSTLVDSFDQFSSLTGNPQLGDEDWSFKVAVVLATWRMTYEDAQEMDVPPLFEEVHEVYLEGLEYFDAASYDIATGLDTLDPTLLEEGGSKLALGNERMARVNELVNELVEERGGR